MRHERWLRSTYQRFGQQVSRLARRRDVNVTAIRQFLCDDFQSSPTALPSKQLVRVSSGKPRLEPHVQLRMRRRTDDKESIIDSGSCIPSSANVGPHFPVGYVDASLEAVAHEEICTGDIVRVLVSDAGDDVFVFLLHGYRRGNDMAVRVQETPPARDLIRRPVLRRSLPALRCDGHRIRGEEERNREGMVARPRPRATNLSYPRNLSRTVVL